MFQNITKYLGVIVLVLFSFYYTDKAVEIVRRNDPIMQSILSNQEKYKVESVNAIIDGDTIIPGINGISVDTEKSYLRMKKINGYYESMLMFSEVIPNESILEQYDKFIIRGNPNRSDVSILLKASNITNLERAYQIFLEKEVLATVFVDGEVVENNMDLMYSMVGDGFELENFGYESEYSEEMFGWTNNMLYSLTNIEPKFCYSEYHNYDTLNLCSKNKMYTVKPTLVVQSSPFYTVKQNLKEGSIIAMSLNDDVIKELPTIISYIKQKGYNIVTLSDIVSESRSEEK